METKNIEEEEKIIKSMIEYVFTDSVKRNKSTARLYIKSLDAYSRDPQFSKLIYEEIQKWNQMERMKTK